MDQRIEIPLKQLNIWTDNPRIANADVNNEDEAISLIFSTVGESKMINLAKDIAKHNLNPNHLPIVVKNEATDLYDVYDGNRRISVLKLLERKDKRLKDIVPTFNLSENIPILVLVTDRKNALRLMEIDHNGESEGIGQIPWEAFQRDIALVDLGKQAKYPNAYNVSKICRLNKKTDFSKISYTDLETIFTNKKIKELFNVEYEWDYQNKEFIINVYNKLLTNKPAHKSYSRYLPTLNKDVSEFDKFKCKLLDEKLSLNSNILSNNITKGEVLTNDVEEKNTKNLLGEPILATKYSLSSEKLTPLEKQGEKNETSSPIVEYTRKNNSYSKQEIKLFEYTSKGLNNIDCSVFKHYLEFVVSHTITTSSTGNYYLCICYFYRVLLETAVREWCKWFNIETNKKMFNLNNLHQKKEKCLNNLVLPKEQTSLINTERLKNIKYICFEHNNPTINKNMRLGFNGISDYDIETFVSDINDFIHGYIEQIDKKKMEKYDHLVLAYLQMISSSKEK